MLTPQRRIQAEKAMNTIINDTGKIHTLIYSNNQIDCPNCVYDPVSGRSTGRYKIGGPQPFPMGSISPVCKGNGKIQSEDETVETVKMTIEWNPKSYQQLTDTIETPNGIAQTVGWIADLPKILRAGKIILESELEGYIKWPYRLFGEPIDPFSITPGKFFLATWKREGSK